MPPLGSVRNRVMGTPVLGSSTAVTRAPGVVLPCLTVAHGPQLSGALWVGGAPPVAKTSPPRSATNSANSSPHGTAVTGAPGVVAPCATVFHSFHVFSWGIP